MSSCPLPESHSFLSGREVAGLHSPQWERLFQCDFCQWEHELPVRPSLAASPSSWSSPGLQGGCLLLPGVTRVLTQSKSSRTHLRFKAHGHQLVLPFCIVPQKTEGPQGKMTCPELMAGPHRPIPTPVPLPAYPTVLGKHNTHTAARKQWDRQMRIVRGSRGPLRDYAHTPRRCHGSVICGTPGDLASFCTHLAVKPSATSHTHTLQSYDEVQILWLDIPGPSQVQLKPLFLSFIQDFLGVCCVPYRYWT